MRYFGVSKNLLPFLMIPLLALQFHELNFLTVSDSSIAFLPVNILIRLLQSFSMCILFSFWTVIKIACLKMQQIFPSQTVRMLSLRTTSANWQLWESNDCISEPLAFIFPGCVFCQFHLLNKMLLYQRYQNWSVCNNDNNKFELKSTHKEYALSYLEYIPLFWHENSTKTCNRHIFCTNSYDIAYY